jgi:hypothetical protein
MGSEFLQVPVITHGKAFDDEKSAGKRPED